MLEKILADKRRQVCELKATDALHRFERTIPDLPPTRNFRSALASGDCIAVIAEIKRKSPSKGMLRETLDPIETATMYQQEGASAISVLTDEQYFAGSLDDLKAVRRSTTIPILRKDFIIDEVQLFEARACGADAVLLIVAALEQDLLCQLLKRTAELGLRALVEVHTETEASRALDAGATIVGINNRDLSTFEVSLDTTLRIRPFLPDTVAIVAESGIHCRKDIEILRNARIDAILVGESIITADDPATKLRELTGVPHDAN